MNRERHTQSVCVWERETESETEREKEKGCVLGWNVRVWILSSALKVMFTLYRNPDSPDLPPTSTVFLLSLVCWFCFSCWSVSHCKYHTTQSLELLSLLSTFISLQSLNFKYHLVIPKFIDPAWPFPLKPHCLLDTSTECLKGIQHVTYPKLSVSDLRLQTYPPSVFSCLSNGKSPPQFSYSSPNVHHLFTSNFLPLPYSPDPSLLYFLHSPYHHITY